MVQIDHQIDVRGMRCPIPVLKASKELRKMDSAQTLEVLASDGQAPRDFTDFCRENGHTLLVNEESDSVYRIVIQKA